MISTAVVLAAGRGRRLRPLTDLLPKPLVQIGEATLLDRTLAALVAAGVEAVAVVAGYRGDDIATHLKGFSAAALTMVPQDELLGSGHAVGLCRAAIGDSPFLAVWSDIITDPVDYLTVAGAAEEGDAAAVGVVEVDDISAGGAVVFGADGRVSSIVEKPVGPPPSYWNSAGIMALGPEIWPHIDALSPSVRGELELTDALAAMVAARERVRAIELHGPWFDIGTPRSLESARQVWG